MGLFSAVGELDPSDNKEQYFTAKHKSEKKDKLCFTFLVL